MMLADKKLPFGVFTISLFALALIISFWPKPSCERLEQDLGNGFFMRWQAPVLLIIRADKQQFSFQDESKDGACEQARQQFSKEAK